MCNENGKYQWKTCIIISMIISIIAIVFSIITLYNSSPRPLCRGFDYLGVIVTSLALITTVLVGWQIYQIVKFDSSNKEIEQLNKDSKKIFDSVKEESIVIRKVYNEDCKTNITICDGFMEMYRDLYNQTQNKKLQYRILYWGMEAVFCAYFKMKNYELCESCIQDIFGYCDDFKDEISCSSLQKKKLIEIVDKCEPMDRIKSLAKLKTLIYNVKISEDAIDYRDEII